MRVSATQNGKITMHTPVNCISEGYWEHGLQNGEGRNTVNDKITFYLII